MKVKFIKIVIIAIWLFISFSLTADQFVTEIDGALQGKAKITNQQIQNIESKVSLSDIFSKPFYRKKLLVILLICCLLSLLGIFIALKKEIFMTLTISQAASAGISFGMFLTWQPTVMAVLFVVFCLSLLTLFRTKAIADQQSALAVLYVFFAGFTILLLSQTAEGKNHITNLFFGDLITITLDNSLLFLVIIGVVIGVHLLWQKMYIPVIFDKGFAEFERIKVYPISFVFNVLQGIVIAYAIKLTGMFFALAFLAILPTAVLLFSQSIKRSFLAAIVSALIVGLLFFILAVLLDLPTSATLSVGAAVFFICTYLAKR